MNKKNEKSRDGFYRIVVLENPVLSINGGRRELALEQKKTGKKKKRN